MPIKNGYEATRDIIKFYERMRKPELLPIISACSAYKGEADKTKASKCGMDFFLEKPINK